MTTLLLRFFLFVCCGLVILGNQAVGGDVVKLPPNATIPAVFMFGDSIVDTGNNNVNLKTPARCNFPPYGREFEGGISTGRYSNGKVPSDLIVEKLGIKELLPAYLDPNLQPNDLLTGVSFAVGATGYDPMTAQIVVSRLAYFFSLAVTPLFDQLRQFEEYIGKLKGIVGEERANFILANSLCFVVASSNDIANTYFVAGVRKLEYDVPSYTDLMLNQASDFFKGLYALGARRIGVFSAPPIGCLPSQRTLGGGVERDCADKPNQAAMLFNSKLSAELDDLKNNLPNSMLIYVDIYNPLLDMIINPTNYVSNKGCCGSGKLEVSILCNRFEPETCTDDSHYLFWDSYHPTEGAYKIIVDELITKYLPHLV
ncbi:GDSL esterase/lipase EXL3-like isoform X2 [Malus domestica]|uniref:GDSL esterase/lipase EXL3-like isoform X2 n=1 Tax=Malus domestica TaxID=3750 RepID=UPI003975FF82